MRVAEVAHRSPDEPVGLDRVAPVVASLHRADAVDVDEVYAAAGATPLLELKGLPALEVDLVELLAADPSIVTGPVR